MTMIDILDSLLKIFPYNGEEAEREVLLRNVVYKCRFYNNCAVSIDRVENFIEYNWYIDNSLYSLSICVMRYEDFLRSYKNDYFSSLVNDTYSIL